ncbi:MAG: sulfatase-like hydrolase/transferase, partial [Bacteroidales bacterium]|nr:sulfatase-like hydrolase/transferase [Bacteroidales bacterium]
YIGLFLTPFFIGFAFAKKQNTFRILLNAITAILITFMSVLAVADAEIYRSWQYRIDASAVSYLSNPSLAFASTPTWRIVMLFVVAIVLGTALFSLYRLCTKKITSTLKSERFFSLIMLIFVVPLFILARGGIGLAPINTGSVYFSENMFANHSAINIGWNFGNYFFHPADDLSKFMYYENAELPSDTTTNELGGVKIFKEKPKHIVFIVLESFAYKPIGYDNPGESVTPRLLDWKDSGILFRNFYASGDRSERGLTSIFSGVPSLPEITLMSKPEMTSKMPSLITSLQKSGYGSTSFYYGGDSDFRNLNSFLYQNSVKEIISQNNTNLNCRTTKWGYDDECMFELFYDHLSGLDSMSVSILYTLSSHEPYDVPT